MIERDKILKLQHECTYCALCIRIERMVAAYDGIKRITAGLTDLINTMMLCGESTVPEDLMQNIAPILQRIISYQQKNQMSQLADVIEGDMSFMLSTSLLKMMEACDWDDINYLQKNIDSLRQSEQKNVIEAIGKKSNEKGSYEVVPVLADTGDISFGTKEHANEDIHYLTGLLHPYLDALQYALYYSQNDKLKYDIAGMGMIYEAIALLKVNYGITVTIYEADVSFVRTVLTYIDLSEYLASGRLSIKIEPSLEKSISKGSLLAKADTLSTMDDHNKESVIIYRSLQLPIKENFQLLTYNFSQNNALGDSYVNDISNEIKGKEIFLIAGGPSLSPCIPILQNCSEDSIILCVGTSAGKLMDNGIKPEFIVLIDGLPVTKKQLMHTFDYDETRLIYLATACHETVMLFDGKRYITYQEGFELSEKAALERKLPLYKTGGSVSTLALDLAVKLGAKKVTCLGLDLAYTYNQFHASGISDNNDVEAEQGKIILKSTSGGEVRTASTLASYHDWIEKYIASTDNLPELVNISDGSYIKGMKNITVSEALKMM
ncbi:motility associated factor glycosyltransferase family protein [Butyrivibrio sp. MC2021]|uniref:motility associated factor glycosyltransferase family protein n=1 Tax=Butyrivibrio sp. MC2021 TaxID=1408306 RepID=UPI00047C71C0|nr:6-hydroxymethylpterin diphosphokinase MptE-like protein [Butyrivibrio sp. MC2021]